MLRSEGQNYLYPTAEKEYRCFRLCHMLSNLYQPIHLFHYDDKVGEVLILAGVNESIEMRIFRNGLWRFTDDEAEF